jgi:hypothetical protein
VCVCVCARARVCVYRSGAELRCAALHLYRCQGVIAHANSRVQFNDKLRNFSLIKGKFAAMEVKMYACESLAYMVAGAMDNGSKDYQIEAAISKVRVCRRGVSTCCRRDEPRDDSRVFAPPCVYASVRVCAHVCVCVRVCVLLATAAWRCCLRACRCLPRKQLGGWSTSASK